MGTEWITKTFRNHFSEPPVEKTSKTELMLVVIASGQIGKISASEAFQRQLCSIKCVTRRWDLENEGNLD